MPHIWPTSASEEFEITILSFTVFLLGLLSQQKCYERLMAHKSEETICCRRAWSVRCSCFYYQWLKAGGYSSLDIFSILCWWLNWYCTNKWHFFLLRQEAVLLLSTHGMTINTKSKSKFLGRALISLIFWLVSSTASLQSRWMRRCRSDVNDQSSCDLLGREHMITSCR